MVLAEKGALYEHFRGEGSRLQLALNALLDKALGDVLVLMNDSASGDVRKETMRNNISDFV